MIHWHIKHQRTGEALTMTGNHPLDWQLATGPVWLSHPRTQKLIEIDGKNPTTWKYVSTDKLWMPSIHDFALTMKAWGMKIMEVGDDG